MASLYWLEAALPGILPCLWMALGVGLPWAYTALDARDWHSRPLIAALALAFGPAWVTAWMLILGIAGAHWNLRALTAESILLGSLVIALLGAALALRKRRNHPGRIVQSAPLAFDEKLIAALIVAAVAIRWIHTAYWPFTAYDALWVYGYEGRLYFLEGYIPQSIGYYPQFLPLQFTYVQALIGAINDQAARMVLPLLHIGSILASYLLGERLINRRVGLFTAALWSLHPYVGQWAVVGDLEIPLTFSFTLAALFFLRAWQMPQGGNTGRREAALAGILLSIALFTKPTAGAFIWGVLLLLALDLALKRGDLRAWLPRLGIGVWTGLACLPLGAIWYLRNLHLGHDAVTLPKALWLTRALRSGDYLAPLALALVLSVIALALRSKLRRGDLVTAAGGVFLVAAGILASNAALFPGRVDPPASHIRALEWLVMLLGLALIAYSLRRWIERALARRQSHQASLASWSLLLALPYFLTFFYSYSYHYRLGFAVLPLLCLPAAMALARILDPDRIGRWSAAWRRAYYVALCLLALPGVIAVAFDVRWTQVWLLQEELDNDFKKYQVFNPSLMEVVTGLEDYLRRAEREAIVLAPGEERLPFFFPQMQIINRPVASLDEFEAIGPTHFIYGAKAREAYLEAGLDPGRTQLIAALGRSKLFEKTKSHYDAVFSYELYERSGDADRYETPQEGSASARPRSEKIFGEGLRLVTVGAFPNMIHKDTPITVEPVWIALRPLQRDYQFVLQLRKMAGGEIAQEWQLRPAAHRHGYYAPSLWDVGEIVKDRQILFLAEETKRPRDTDFVFALGVWDPEEQRYLPLEIDGEPAGEFYQISGTYRLRK